MNLYDGTQLPFRRFMKGELSMLCNAPEGAWAYDHTTLSKYQIDCANRFCLGNQIENEFYLAQHPEITGLLKLIVSDRIGKSPKATLLRDTALRFSRPEEEIEADLIKILGTPLGKRYSKNAEYNEDLNMEGDLIRLKMQSSPSDKLDVPSPPTTTPTFTASSSFLSISTSTMTLPTPEPVPTPEPTLSEIFYNIIITQMDKAVYSQVNDEILRYDTAYVELQKAVETAMEVPVIPIREDIINLLNMAYAILLVILDQKDTIAAEIAWEKRMRKKLKKTLRKQKNFKGYETPPTPKSVYSSHPSYTESMLPPCKCHPTFLYNRYPKDRFGIYLPRETEFSSNSVTICSNSMERIFRIEDGSSSIAETTSDKVVL